MKPLQPPTELLQLPLLLIQTAKHGSISLQTNGEENIQLQIENNKIDLNFLQKEQITTLFQLKTEMQEESILKTLKELKNLAEKLKQNRLTITISFRGQTIITLGYNAKPTISQLVTETDAVEVNNLIELLKLTT